MSYACSNTSKTAKIIKCETAYFWCIVREHLCGELVVKSDWQTGFK